MARLVVLLRGINLGSRNRIAMADLRATLEAAGYKDVRTHLQSGNVVLDTRQGPDRAARRIKSEIHDAFGLSVDVIVRTADEIAGVVAANPLGDIATNGSRQFVVFLSDEPDADAVAALGREDFEPERLVAHGREIHLWCPDGVRDSRVMKTATRQPLAPTSTFRNWNTVAKLHELASE
jgi:uncharacterized protein (DUF1697 family)